MKVNVFKQGSMYYTRIMVKGKRVCRCMDTSDRQIAMKRARDLKLELLSGRWAQVDETSKRKNYPTISEIIAAYVKAGESRNARFGKPTKRTLMDNVNALQRVLGDGMLDQPITILDRKLSTDYCDKKTLGKSGEDLNRSRRTAFTCLRGAKSVFCKWAMAAYEDLNLHVPSDLLGEFLKATPIDGSTKKYRVPLEHPQLVADTITAGRDLAQTDPRLHLVFLLSYELALRAGESIDLEWSWFRHQGGSHTLDIIKRDHWSPKGTERSIPIHPLTWEAIAAHDSGGRFVLGDGEDHERPQWKQRRDGRGGRYLLVIREFSSWMRSIGWTAARFAKTNHELRKLQGSRWFTEVSPQAAQEWLGHADLSTTCKFYAALRSQPEPLTPEAV